MNELIDENQRRFANAIVNNDFHYLENESNALSLIIENGLVSLSLKVIDKCNTKGSLHHKLKKLDREFFIINTLQIGVFENLFITLKEKNIQFLVLKGWALSYQVYENPHERPKTDLDILIDSSEKNKIIELFLELGFSNPRGWEPKAIIDQFTMRKMIAKDIYANVDIHLELTNDKALQPLFSWEELNKSAVYSEKLNALVVGKAYSLLHAIIHLLHHACNLDFLKLIWFYDIYLVTNNFDENELEEFKTLAVTKGLSEVISVTLQQQNKLFPNKNCDELIKELNEFEGKKDFKYLISKPSKAKLFYRNFKKTEGAKKKIVMLKEVFLPPKEEIYNKFGHDSKVPLMLLYLIRIIFGIKKYLWK